MENRALCHLAMALPLTIATIVGFTENNPVFAQLTPDNTLGAESSIVTPQQLRDLIQGGAIRDGALFHSFDEFNVGSDRGVFFDLQNNTDILNIFTRVTGGNVSNILGTLGVLQDALNSDVLGNANLFLLNPNGITFGGNANLQLNGSFFATTADGFGFDNFTFSASGEEAPPPLLTISIPRSINFRDNPGDIAVNQSNLSVSQGQNLSLVGRNVTVNGGQLNAEGGRIEIAGMFVPGNVTINEDFSLAFPDEVIPSGATSLPIVRLPETGTVTINTNILNLSNGAEIVSQTQNSPVGGVTINAEESVNITNGGRILSILANGTGNSQGITIDSPSVLVDGQLAVNRRSLIAVGGRDREASSLIPTDAGNLDINTNTLTVSNNAQILTLSFDSFLDDSGDFEDNNTNVGNITINATESVHITNGSLILAQAQAQSNPELSPEETGGNVGGIFINSPLVSLEGGEAGNSSISLLIGQNFNLQNAGIGSVSDPVNQRTIASVGRLEINTRTLSLDGINQDQGGGILVLLFGVGSIGDDVDGNFTSILINAEESITLDNNSLISAQTRGSGNSGDIVIKTPNLELNENSAILNQTGTDFIDDQIDFIDDQIDLTNLILEDNELATGNAGDIILNVGTLSLTHRNPIFSDQDGSSIQTLTFGTGDAGDILIKATEGIFLSSNFTNNDGSQSLISSNFGSQSDIETGFNRVSGNITIDTGSLSLDNSQITTSTEGNGNAGNIDIQASESIFLTGNSTISSSIAETATGNGGNITLQASNLTINDGALVQASNSGIGNAGSIKVDVSDTVTLNGIGSGIFSNVGEGASGNGGFINIDPEQVNILNGATISASNQGIRGDAGRVSIVSDNLLLQNNGLISAQDNSGAGGFIDLRIEDFLILNNSTISAAGTQAGSLDLQSIALVMTNGSLITVDSENSAPFANFDVEAFFVSPDSTISVDGDDLNFNTQVSITPTVEVETIEPDQQITQSVCQDFGGEGRLANTGRGGLSYIPGLVPHNSVINVDLVDEVPPAPPPEAIKPHHRTDVTFINSEGEEFKPAMGAVLLPNGMVEFVDYNPAEVYRDMYAAAGCSGR